MPSGAEQADETLPRRHPAPPSPSWPGNGWWPPVSRSATSYGTGCWAAPPTPSSDPAAWWWTPPPGWDHRHRGQRADRGGLRGPLGRHCGHSWTSGVATSNRPPTSTSTPPDVFGSVIWN